MQLYMIRRRTAWKSPEELGATAERSKQVAEDDYPDDIAWIRSYVIEEEDGTLGIAVHLPGLERGRRAQPRRRRRDARRSRGELVRVRVRRDRDPGHCIDVAGRDSPSFTAGRRTSPGDTVRFWMMPSDDFADRSGPGVRRRGAALLTASTPSAGGPGPWWALGALAPGGTIFLHDTWPLTADDTLPEVCGDVYRLREELEAGEVGEFLATWSPTSAFQASRSCAHGHDRLEPPELGAPVPLSAMATTEDRSGAATHEVFNQAPPLENHNVFDSDRPLVEAVDREGADWAADRIAELGAVCGRPDTIRLGIEANENPPKLKTHDRFGNRIDEVEFHPAWHELMRSASPTASTPRRGATRSRARTSRAAPRSCSSPRSRPASAARSR